MTSSSAATPPASGSPMDLIGKTVRWETTKWGGMWFTARVFGEYDDELNRWDGFVVDPGNYRMRNGNSLYPGMFVGLDPENLAVIDSEPYIDDPECE